MNRRNFLSGIATVPFATSQLARPVPHRTLTLHNARIVGKTITNTTLILTGESFVDRSTFVDSPLHLHDKGTIQYTYHTSNPSVLRRFFSRFIPSKQEAAITIHVDGTMTVGGEVQCESLTALGPCTIAGTRQYL